MDKIKKSSKNKISKSRIIISLIVLAIIVIIIATIAIRTNVTDVGGEAQESLSTLKVGTNGTYELSVVNYTSIDSGEQEFIIEKTDEYGNPIENVTFEIAGNFKTSYTIEYYKDEKIMSDYTEEFYGCMLDDRYFVTDQNGEISLTLLYGDYGIVETDVPYGYDLDDTILWIRVDENGINLITESDVSWDYTLDGTISVSTAVIEDRLKNIENDLGYELSYIMLNNKKIGTLTSSLPTTVNDGDVIKLYTEKITEKTYSIYFYSYPYGNFTELEELGEEQFIYTKSDTFDVDGLACIEFDMNYIDDVLVSEGFEGCVCYVYDTATVEFGVSCAGAGSLALDGNDEVLISASYVAWYVGDANDSIVNNGNYVEVGNDIYVFVITDEEYSNTKNTYTMYFYDYPYGSISNAKVIESYELKYNDSDVVNQDNKDCIKLDCETIDTKLEELGYNSESMCYVYASDFYDNWEGMNCNSWVEPRICRWK